MTAKEEYKVWFILGASSGLGLCLSKLLLALGYKVVACARHEASIDDKNCLKLICDITNPEQIRKAIEIADKTFGGIDVCVNSVGVANSFTIEESIEEDVRETFEINYWGTYYFLKEFIPYFRKKGKGTLISHSSQSGLSPRFYGAAYCSTKYAIEGLMSVAWLETKDFLRVMTVECGSYPDTNINGKWKETHNNLEETKLDCYKEEHLYDIHKANYRLQNLCNIPFSYRQLGEYKNHIEKAMEVLIEVVTSDEPLPRRLMLGQDACVKINAEANHINYDVFNSLKYLKRCSY